MKKILFILSFIYSSVSASHCSGGFIYFENTHDSTYKITLSFYRDCAGIPAPNSPSLYISSVSGAVSEDLDLKLISNKEVSNYCTAEKTTCEGGTVLGIERYDYSGTVKLKHEPDWIFSYSLCCRSASITNISNPGNASIYIFSMLNNLTEDNNSPQFRSDPVPFVCLGSSYCFDNGTTGGDSLIYSLITPKQNAGETVSFVTPYTYTEPLASSSGVNLDASTGQLCFYPYEQQVVVMAVIVSNYKNNILLSQVERDMLIVISACDCEPLPIVLLSFSGENKGGRTVLRWSTASEINNHYFTIARCEEGECLPIGKVNGAKFSDHLLDYTFTDYNYKKGMYIYQLSQTDYNGTTTDLKSIAVENDGISLPSFYINLIGQRTKQNQLIKF